MSSLYSNKIFIALSLILSFAVIAIIVLPGSETPSYKEDRVLRYSLTVQNPTNKLVKDSTAWAYMPVKRTSAQQFKSIDVSEPYSLIVDDLGNQKILFQLGDIPPYGSKIVSVKIYLKLSNAPNIDDVDEIDIYLAAEQNIEADHQDIKRIASELKANEDHATARNIYSWIIEHMEYKGFVPDDRGALYALKNGTGDCTEYSQLFTAMARSTGMPTRTVAGFVSSEDAYLKAKDFHNWSEVYIDGRWWLVDAQKEVFMQEHDHYVAMRIVSHSTIDDVTNSQKYFHADLPLLAVMN